MYNLSYKKLLYNVNVKLCYKYYKNYNETILFSKKLNYNTHFKSAYNFKSTRTYYLDYNN